MKKNIEKIITKDGSIGLYNKDLDEVYHSREGAITEAYEKFIAPCLILNKKPLKILDICYGIGYKTKYAIENYNTIKVIDCIKIKEEKKKKSFQFDYKS